MNEAMRQVLLVRCGESLCALPLAGVLEIMRPLPCEPVQNAPEFVLGMSLIRGAFVPVVDLAALVTGARGAPIGRYVSVLSDGRHLALAVSEVLAVRALPSRDFSALPELLRGDDSPFVAALARLDARLLRLLREARVWSQAVPELDTLAGAHADA